MRQCREELPDIHFLKICDIKNIVVLEKEIETQYLRGVDVCAIVSFVDPYCYIANKLAEKYGLYHFTIDAIQKMQNKIYTHEVLNGTPYTPHFKVFDKTTDLNNIYDEMKEFQPFVIKSPESSGSKDVIKINNFKEFNREARQLILKYPEIPIMAEEYLDGSQYLVETIVNKKSIQIIAVFQQEVTFVKRFIVTGYNLLLNNSAEFIEYLERSVREIINYFGLETGTCHLEMRYVKEKWKLIEINPRISGSGMNKMIEAAFGFSFVEETLKMALGREPNIMIKYKKNLYVQQVTVSETGYLEKVTGKKKAANSPGVVEVFIKPRKGSFLHPPLSMGDRYAYVIATGPSEEQAKANAKYAASQIKFHLVESAPSI